MDLSKSEKKNHLDNWFTKNAKLIYEMAYVFVMLLILVLAATDQIYDYVGIKAGEASIFFIIEAFMFAFYIGYQIWITVKKQKELKKHEI